MGMIDNAESIMRKAQEKVGAEQVLAVGILQPAGTWGAAGLGQLSGLAGILKQKKANEAAGGMGERGAFFKTNRQVLMAITPTSLVSYNTKTGWGGLKVLDEIATWKRDDLEVSVEEGKIADKVVFDHAPSGGHYELEATKVGTRGFHDGFFAELEKLRG